MVPPQLDMTVPRVDMTESLCGYSCNVIGRWNMIPLSLGRIRETYCNQLFRHVLNMYLTHSCEALRTLWGISKTTEETPRVSLAL